MQQAASDYRQRGKKSDGHQISPVCASGVAATAEAEFTPPRRATIQHHRAFSMCTACRSDNRTSSGSPTMCVNGTGA
jgi:hypothetical protein